MRRRIHAKSGLFLIELMIAILLFMVTAGVFLRAFVKSHQMSEDAEALFEAQKLASDAADILEKSEDFTGDLKKYFPGICLESPGKMAVEYDKEWKESSKKGGVYEMAISWNEVSGLWHTEIVVSKTGGKELYRLTLKIYCPREGGAAS